MVKRHEGYDQKLPNGEDVKRDRRAEAARALGRIATDRKYREDQVAEKAGRAALRGATKDSGQR